MCKVEQVDELIRQNLQKSLGRSHPPFSGRRRLLNAAASLRRVERTLLRSLLEALIKDRPLELPEGFELSAYHENRLFPPIFVYFFLRPV
jgi:hypothetical protein